MNFYDKHGIDFKELSSQYGVLTKRRQLSFFGPILSKHLFVAFLYKFVFYKDLQLHSNLKVRDCITEFSQNSLQLQKTTNCFFVSLQWSKQIYDAYANTY